MELAPALKKEFFIVRFFRNAWRHNGPQHVKGFTLIEMIVVLAIIGILTSILLLSQSTFNQSLLLNDTAYSIAFSARQAQTFGLSSHSYGGFSNAGYGLHFESGAKGTYILFADTSKTLAIPTACPVGVANTPEQKPGNCRFDVAGTADGIASTYTFTRGFHVSKFCGYSTGVVKCSTDSANPLASMDIVFTRPNTTTTITGLLSGAQVKSYTCAEVTLSDANEAATRTIRISSLGEVSINQLCPQS